MFLKKQPTCRARRRQKAKTAGNEIFFFTTTAWPSFRNSGAYHGACASAWTWRSREAARAEATTRLDGLLDELVSCIRARTTSTHEWIHSTMSVAPFNMGCAGWRLMSAQLCKFIFKLTNKIIITINWNWYHNAIDV